jgi:hypothetical protein
MDRRFQAFLLTMGVFYMLLFLRSKKVKSLSDLSLDIEESNWPVVLGIFAVTMTLVTIYIVSLYWVEVKEILNIKTPKEKSTVPVADPHYETASSLFKNMQENDRNYLMFGRSPQVTSTNDSYILKGYELSSNIGDSNTYGTFTGMTLYGGPDMYDATGIEWGGKSVSDAEAAKFIASR